MRRRKEDFIVIALALILVAVIFGIAIIMLGSPPKKEDKKPIGEAPTLVPTRATTPADTQLEQVENGELLYNVAAADRLVDLAKNKRVLSNEDEAAKRKSLLNLPPGRTYGYLYESQNIRLEYVESMDEYIVEILTEDIPKAKQEAISWLTLQGFSREAICTYPVMFYLNSEVMNTVWDENIVFSPLPDNCDDVYNVN